MKPFLRNFSEPTASKRKFTFLLFDIIAFSGSLILAFEIRNELSNIVVDYNYYHLLLLFIPIKIIVFASLKLYDISWKFVSLQDLANIAKACLISSGIIFILLYGTNLQSFSDFPRTIFLIDFLLTFLFSSTFKISKRFYLEVMRQSIRKSILKRTLIVGAGSSGEQLLRDINRSQSREFYPIGFVDDDPGKQNLYLQGLKVLGTTEKLSELLKKNNVETILISVLSADREFHRKILNIARNAGVPDVKVVSTLNDISDNFKVSIKDIRDIDVSDLIGRQAVSINTEDINRYVKNKRVLITGAAGSVGSEIARQILYYFPKEVGILDINESDLADLEIQLKRTYDSEIRMFLCDISNEHKVNKIFEKFAPDVVFHAAAYKHVPVMEKFPEEAVRVNILGTYYLANAALKYNTKNFILISTDKAVNPTSIMGASKRIAENIVTGAGKRNISNFVVVRFGNVIGSRGSVLPIFMEQIKNGGPITVTHPEMKRYFMTIPEAVALVLQASATGRNGDVYVLDMGEPIKILDLVKDLILLHNLIPDQDIKIEFTGIREGEKLFEEVLTAEEGVIATKHEKIFKARMVYMQKQSSIDLMVKDLCSMNGHTSKDDWLTLFKIYVPTFQAPDNPVFDGMINEKSYSV
jgi:FlaA1/EpsC-like NDP-sugar epimerase